MFHQTLNLKPLDDPESSTSTEELQPDATFSGSPVPIQPIYQVTNGPVSCSQTF